MIRKVLALPLTFLLAGSLLAENQTFTKIKYMKPVEDKSKEIDSRLILSDDQVEVGSRGCCCLGSLRHSNLFHERKEALADSAGRG